MAAIICAACGAKTKEGRLRCPRCGETLVAAAVETASLPAIDPAALWSRFRGPLVIAGAAMSLGLLVLIVARTQLIEPLPAEVSSTPPPVKAPAPPPVAVRAVPPVPEPVTSFDLDRAGAAAYHKGDFAGALERFEQAVDKNPDDPGAQNDLGQTLVRLGRPREALPHFVRATELNPTAWAPRFNLANAYGAMGEWGRAIPEYQKAGELFPDDYVTTYNLGLAYHKAGEEEPAVKAFERAIELAPGEPTFHLSLGISYEKLNRREDAAKAYEAYLEMAPEAADAAKIRAHIGDLRKPAQS